MKKNKFMVMLLLLSCILAGGCTDDKSEQDTIEKMGEESSVKRQTLGEIWDTWDEVLEKKYKNIEVSPELCLEKPEEAGVFCFVQSDDIVARKEQIFDEFIPKDRRIKRYYRESDPRMQPNGPEYVNKKSGEHLYLGNTGFFNYQKRPVEDYDETMLVETVSLRRPYVDKKYMLEDGEILLGDAVKLAEALVERWEDTVDYDLGTRAHKVDIYSSKGKHILVFSFEKYYKGINIMTDMDMNKDRQTNEVSCYDDEVVVTSCKGADAYVSTTGIIYKRRMIKKLDQIVSLESALNQIEGKMAGQIERITLSYRLYNPQVGSCGIEGGAEYVSKLYWVFYFCEETGNEHYAMVDCRTGEAEYVRNEES